MRVRSSPSIVITFPGKFEGSSREDSVRVPRLVSEIWLHILIPRRRILFARSIIAGVDTAD